MKLKPKISGYLIFLLLTLFLPVSNAQSTQPLGAVYTASNEADGNAILVFARDRLGKLTPAGEFPTEGLGTGTGLGNQGGVILDPANRWLFAVNAGSNDISVFAVEEHGLTLVERAPSNGQRPISLTYAHNRLYVLNAGGAIGGEDSITGFAVGADGNLAPLAGSTRPLSALSTGPAQIQFNGDGDLLVVTEKATNLLDVYTLDDAGVANGHEIHPSQGDTPFGFAFGKRDTLFVSEAAGGAQDQSSLSSYALAKNGGLQVINASVGTTETAACWVVVSQDGRYAYTTNAGSGSVSGYRIAFDGSLTLLNKSGRTGLTGNASTPIDMALSNDGRNLYTLNAGNGSIGVFRVKPNGGLKKLPVLHGLPASANGLAAR